MTLDLIGLIVANMAESLAFYRELGLEIPKNADKEDHVEVQLPNGLRLAWDTIELIKSFNPNWTKPAGSQISLAFKCKNPAEVDTIYQRLTEKYPGYSVPWDAFWGQRYAVLKDPDGNHIDLFANMV